MAVQMTRAEYEKQYGSAPALSSSKIDTTPAPIRMTREEYEARYRPSDSPAPLRDRLADVGNEVSSTISDSISGEGEFAGKSPLQRGVQATAAGFSTVPRGAYELLPSFARGALDKAGEFIQKGFDKTTGAIADTQLFREVGQAEAEAQQQGTKSPISGLRNALETTAAAGEIAGTIAGAGETAAAGTIARNVGNKINVAPLVKRVTTPTPNKIEAKRSAALLEVEEKYAGLRKLNEFSKDGGAESRARISRTNVLADAIDEDGLIRTKGEGGAIEQYRKMTIEGVEDVVKRNLEREGKTVTLPEVKRALRVALTDSGLEGADLVTALKGVEREIKGLALRADDLTQLPLAKLQDAKVSTTRNINFNTPPETKTYRKAVARAYKELIEKKSDFNVKEVNAELAKFYKDIERLEALDGKRVKGGRLGKYFAQVSGNIVGGAAGSAVGGPVGTALGTIAGGEAASFIAGKSMARSFGKGGILPDKNPILEQARKEAGLPPGRSLETPDPVVGIPSATKALIEKHATPEQKREIAKTQRQMKENVAKQKAAIKDKDYTLAASLKDVYDALVDTLKTLVAEVVESIKNPTIGLSIKKSVTPEKVAKKMDFEDFENVARFLEDPQAALLDDALMRMVDEMEIGNAPLDMQVEFLIKVSDEADRLGLLQSNNLGKRNTQYSPTATASNTDITETVSQSAQSATTKTTDLLEEARKYDSAEEFVKAQGEPVFHGGKVVVKEFKKPTADIFSRGTSGGFGTGIYFTNNKSFTTRFGKNVTEAYIKPNTKLFDALDENRKITKQEAEALTKSLKAASQDNPDWLEVLENNPDGFMEGDRVGYVMQEIQTTIDPNEFTKVFKEAGFDGINYKETHITDIGKERGGFETVVFDPNAIKTRSQLEEIWEQANRK